MKFVETVWLPIMASSKNTLVNAIDGFTSFAIAPMPKIKSPLSVTNAKKTIAKASVSSAKITMAS